MSTAPSSHKAWPAANAPALRNASSSAWPPALWSTAADDDGRAARRPDHDRTDRGMGPRIAEPAPAERSAGLMNRLVLMGIDAGRGAWVPP